MAGSLGELVVKVSATADRFKSDLKQMEGGLKGFQGQAEKTKASLSGIQIGDMGRGFLAGLGIGSAIQGITTITHMVGDLTKTLAMAAFEGKNVGDALDNWASHKVGLKGVAEMFGEMADRSKAISDLSVKLDQDVGRMMGTFKDPAGAKQIQEINTQIAKLDIEAQKVQNRLDSGFTFGASGDLKIELGSLLGDMDRLRTARDDFAKKIADAEAFQKKQQDQKKALDEAAAMQEKWAQGGAALAKALRTPQEAYNETLQDTLKLLRVGAIDTETFKRQVGALGKQLEDAEKAKETAKLNLGPVGGVGAVEAGTVEGFSASQSSFRAQDALARQAAAAQQEQTRATQAAARQSERLEKAMLAAAQATQAQTDSFNRIFGKGSVGELLLGNSTAPPQF